MLEIERKLGEDGWLALTCHRVGEKCIFILFFSGLDLCRIIITSYNIHLKRSLDHFYLVKMVMFIGRLG